MIADQDHALFGKVLVGMTTMISRCSLGFLAGLALLLPGCAEQQISVVNSTVTSLQNAELDKLTPQSTFAMDDVIRVVVYFTWPDVTARGGMHHAEWNWYKGDQLVSHTHNLVRFMHAPADLWTNRPAAALGAGNYKVETVLDGKVVCTNTFTIKT